MSQATVRSDPIGDYLASKLENAIPFVRREARFFFQPVDVGNRAIFAEHEDQQVKKPLVVRSRLSQDNSCSRPGSLA